MEYVSLLIQAAIGAAIAFQCYLRGVEEGQKLLPYRHTVYRAW